jgi:hypothetical protein
VKLSRDGDGRARVRLNLAESHVLEQLFHELLDVLAPDALGPDDPVRRRLYPAAYADAGEAQAFRELTEAGLQADRSERVEGCLADLRSGRTIRRTEVVLDGEAAERWLRVLNDLRLAFGTRLQISEDDDYELDETDPDVQLKARYLWLTALQDALVTTVMG